MFKPIGDRMAPIIIMFSDMKPVPDWVNARTAPNSLIEGRGRVSTTHRDAAPQCRSDSVFFNRRCAQTISVTEPYLRFDM